MSAAGGYRGIGFSGVDSKSRFTLPVDLRHRVRAGSGEQNLLHIQLVDHCPFMTGFGSDYLARLDARVEAQALAALQRGEAFDEHRQDARSHGNVEDVNFDDGGRFSLPEDIKQIMHVDDCLFFVGARMTFEIWAPDTFLASDLGTELQRVRCRALLDQWRASPKNPRKGGAA